MGGSCPKAHPGGGFRKWLFNGTMWALTNTLAGTNGVRDLAGTTAGFGNAGLCGTMATSPLATLVTMTDLGDSPAITTPGADDPHLSQRNPPNYHATISTPACPSKPRTAAVPSASPSENTTCTRRPGLSASGALGSQSPAWPWVVCGRAGENRRVTEHTEPPGRSLLHLYHLRGDDLNRSQ
jgi:hypothetical protein